jgi:hypothetical protein
VRPPGPGVALCSEKPTEAAPVAVAVLDDALTTLRFGVRDGHGANPAVVENARSSVDTYLETLDSAVQSAEREPLRPRVDALRRAFRSPTPTSSRVASTG